MWDLPGLNQFSETSFTYLLINIIHLTPDYIEQRAFKTVKVYKEFQKQFYINDMKAFNLMTYD
jgi:hypothetical protein